MVRALAIVAAVAAALMGAGVARALDIHVQSPPNGYVVVIRGDETWVDFTMQFTLDGCAPSPYSELNVDGPFEYTPLNGGGKKFVSPVYASDHVSHPPLWQPKSTIYDGRVSTYVPGWLVSDGERLRWSVSAWCAKLGSGDNLYTHASGMLRIEKRGSGAGASTGSGSSQPPATTTPTSPPPKNPPPTTTSTGVGGGANPFRITHIDSPASVRQNGPRGTATIHWSGRPRFPVTIHDEPASCPAGFTCSSETKVATERANPLKWAAWWCSGNVSASWKLDFRFWLTDATGRRTQKVRQQVLCKVH